MDAIGIVTADLAASLTFYHAARSRHPRRRGIRPHVEVTLPGGQRLLWDTEDVVRSYDPGWTAPTGGDRLSLAFLCDGPAEVDAVYDDLTGAGYRGHLKPWDAVWGQRYATVLDPDGCAVSLFAANG